MSRIANLAGKGAFIYGTAWKKDRTASLVLDAVAGGFRGFDVAAQPKRYREDLVGVALREAIHTGVVSRADLFVSTCCTVVVCDVDKKEGANQVLATIGTRSYQYAL